MSLPFFRFLLLVVAVTYVVALVTRFRSTPRLASQLLDRSSYHVYNIPLSRSICMDIAMGAKNSQGSPTRVDTKSSIFAGTKISPPLSTSLLRLGVVKPTPIQEAAILPLLTGLTCIVHAETGSGKTLAYLIPLLKRLYGSLGSDSTGGDWKPLQALVIVPSKEMVVQVAADIVSLTSQLREPPSTATSSSSSSSAAAAAATIEQKFQLSGKNGYSLTFDEDIVFACLRNAKSMGISPQQQTQTQTHALKAPIVVGTPIKILDLLRNISPKDISNINYVVLDEIDRLLSAVGKYASNDEKRTMRNSQKPICEILSTLYAVKTKEEVDALQIVAVSATVGRPLRRELHRVISGGREFGDIPVLRPLVSSTTTTSTSSTSDQTKVTLKKSLKEEEGEDKEGNDDDDEEYDDEDEYNDDDDEEEEDEEEGYSIEDIMDDSISTKPDKRLKLKQNGKTTKVTIEKPLSAKAGSSRSVGIPTGIKHTLLLCDDVSLTRKLALAKEKWVNARDGGSNRGMIFVPLPEDVSKAMGILQFWGMNEAVTLQKTMGVERRGGGGVGKYIEKVTLSGKEISGQSSKNSDKGKVSKYEDVNDNDNDNDDEGEEQNDIEDELESLYGEQGNSRQNLNVIENRRQVVKDVIRERLGALHFRSNSMTYQGNNNDVNGVGKDNNKEGDTQSNNKELVVLPVSLARGLHIADVEHVFVLQPPAFMDEYLHMSGRTCRAGNNVKTGNVVTLVTLEEMKRMMSWQTALGIKFDVLYA